MTYKQLQDDVIERLNGDSSAASSALRTRIKRFLNTWYRRILARGGMARIRDVATTLTTAAATSEYQLTLSAVRQIYDPTNQWKLVERTLGWIRERDPGLVASGNPICYVIKERTRTTVDILIWPVPTGIAALNVDGESVVTEMSLDGDFAVIPEDYHYILADGALYSEYLRMGDVSRAEITRQDIADGIAEMRKFLLRSGSGGRLQPGRAARLSGGRSRLGSFFPSDTFN